MNRILIIAGTPLSNLKLIEGNGVQLSDSIKKFVVSKENMHLAYPSLGAITLASYLNNKGYSVAVCDWYLDSFDVTQFPIIGISSSFMDKSDVCNIAKKIKTLNNTCKIVLGGPISWSHTPTTLLETIPEIDFIVYKEGEKAFVNLIQAINNGSDFDHVKSLAYRKENTVICTDLESPLPVAEIAQPDWSLWNFKKGNLLLPVETARGCVFDCAFCSEVHYWGKPVRFRNIQKIIDEIHNNIKTTSVLTYRFADSCFTAPEERCAQMCDALANTFIDKGIPIKWSSYARVTNLNRPLLEKMRRAGCVCIDIGMETGDETVLNQMNKKYSPSKIIEGVQTAKKLGILTHCNLVIGFPGETIKTIANTIEILNNAKPDTFQCMKLFVAPNTNLNANKAKYGLKGDRLDWQHESMTSSEADEVIPKIIKSVKHSCLLPAGEIVAILLTSRGYSVGEIRSCFENLAKDRIGTAEQKMFNDII